MKNILSFLLLVIKFYISFKVLYVLYIVSNDPNQENTNQLIWWSGLLIFDMWIMNMLPPISEQNKEDKDDDYLDNFRK